VQGKAGELTIALVGAELEAVAHRATSANMLARVRDEASAAKLGRLEQQAKAALARLH